MPRYYELKTREEEPVYDGDPAFTGMNMDLERTALEPGQYPLAINKRCSRGVMETRPGTLTPVGANLEEREEILAVGLYNNPNGQKVSLMARPHEVEIVQDGFGPRHVKIPAGLTLSGRLEFSQQFDKVLLHRGRDESVNTLTNTSRPHPDRITLVWDGKSSAGFVPITKSSALTERALFPNADYAINFGDRAIAAVNKDQVVASDPNDYSITDLIAHTFRINAGTADPITGLYGMTNAQLLVGKEESIDVLNNFVGDLSAVSARIVSDTIGISARKSWIVVGDNGVFLHRSGVYRTARTQDTEGRLLVPPFPLFAKPDRQGKIVDPIGRLIRRINWPAAKNAVATKLSPYYMLAVPLDGSLVNNAVIIGNMVSEQWEAYDIWHPESAMQIDDLCVMDYSGHPAVYAVNREMKSVHVLYLGHEDEIAYNRETERHIILPIHDLFETRAYATAVGEGRTRREFKKITIKTATWRPEITVTQLMDNQMDERKLTPASPITKNPRKYYRAFVPDYNLTNANNDFHAPGREDYSVVPPAPGVFPGSKGITPGLMQDRPLPFSIFGRGQHVSYRIENTQGRCTILSTELEAKGKGKEIKQAA